MIPAARFEWKDPRSSAHVKSRLGWLSRSSTKYGAGLLVWTAVHCMYGVLRASTRSPHSFTRQGYGLPSLQASVCSKLSFLTLRLSVRRTQVGTRPISSLYLESFKSCWRLKPYLRVQGETDYERYMA
ncbi:hypothetical protein V8C34DRAFT_312833 [Trichoderma compactum]